MIHCRYWSTDLVPPYIYYISTFTGSDVTSPLCRSTVLCALRASCHAAVITALRKLVPGVRRIIGNYQFEILNFDAELERTHN